MPATNNKTKRQVNFKEETQNAAIGERQPLQPAATETFYSAMMNNNSFNTNNHNQNNNHPQQRRTLSAQSLLNLSRRSNYRVSSLDFERVINHYSIQAIQHHVLVPDISQRGHAHPMQQRPSLAMRMKSQRRHLLGYTGRTATRWILTVICGLLTGLTSILLVTITGAVVRYRSHILHQAVAHWDLSNAVLFQAFLWTNVLLALMSSILCVAWVPPAAGSGIPEVKAYLNGVRSIQKLANWPLFTVKMVGTILSVSSALSIGQEGPLIHIGAIMGSSCTKIGAAISRLLIHWNARQNHIAKHHHHHHHHRPPPPPPPGTKKPWTEKLLSWTMVELSHFATDAERRDLVSIGASVGFAASFGAPIGGLLFILDDVSSYFERHLLLRMLVANAIGTFCLAVVHGDLSNYSIISMGTYDTPNDDLFVNRLVEVPLYVLMGLGGGLLGGLFCAGFLWLRKNITSKFPPAGAGRAKWQLMEVAVVSILTSVVLFYLPMVPFACKSIPEADLQALQQFDGNMTAALDAYYDDDERSKNFFCPPGQINEMATIMFGSRIAGIKEILTNPGAYQQRTLIVLGFVFYILTLITFGTAIPSGIFTPTVLVGAALGGAAGNAFHQYIDEEISPSTFALLGVAALLAGIQRSTVSVAVILVEGTGQIKVLSPVIIVVVIARYVAQSIHKLGIFETCIEYKQYPYLEHEKTKRYYEAMQVKHIMSEPPVETVQPQEQVGTLVELLETSAHHGFPVVERGTGRFLGLVRRAQIAALLECGVFSKDINIRGETELAAATFGIQVFGDSTPLMHWAYHINDDRYDHIMAIPDEQNPKQLIEMDNRIADIQSSIMNQPDKPDAFGADEAKSLLTEEQRAHNKSIRMSLMPSAKRTSSMSELPQDFATVTQNEAGNVIVSWYNTEFEDYWVNLAAVANLGTYTVPEFCPVTKAYSLFASLGLRHIVVLGGSSGGEVVGMLTRASFLESHIEAASADL